MSIRDAGKDGGQSRDAVIVVRAKRAKGDGEHHGGAWKIAYADFMTAMMAFFLVMWLVNSTDDKTIVQVAAYFNPLKLSEKKPSERGLEDGTFASLPQGGKAAQNQAPVTEDESREPTNVHRKKKGAKRPAPSEPEPSMETLDKLAAQAEGYLAKAGESGAVTEAQLRDPWQVHTPPALERAREGTQSRRAAPTARSSPDEAQVDREKKRAASAQGLASDIAGLLDRVRGQHPGIEVTLTSEGVLISLMDKRNFGMFAIASSEPRPELVVLLREIGELLAQRSGGLVVAGHTDGRPFRTASNDNWRLSTARAHSARLMLLRGGLDERRFERIEGRADKALRNASDPEAPENRRIDILLRASP